MLKVKASIFSESHKKLFGQNFREDWCTNLKNKLKYQDFQRKETKLTPTTFKHSAGIDRTFEGVLQHHHIEEVVEGVHHKNLLLEQCYKHKRQHDKSNKITLPQQSTTS